MDTGRKASPVPTHLSVSGGQEDRQGGRQRGLSLRPWLPCRRLGGLRFCPPAGTAAPCHLHGHPLRQAGSWGLHIVLRPQTPLVGHCPQGMMGEALRMPLAPKTQSSAHPGTRSAFITHLPRLHILPASKKDGKDTVMMLSPETSERKEGGPGRAPKARVEVKDRNSCARKARPLPDPGQGVARAPEDHRERRSRSDRACVPVREPSQAGGKADISEL